MSPVVMPADVQPLTWPRVRAVLLTAVAAVLFAVGWCGSQLVRVLTAVLFAAGFAVSWCWAAVAVGWKAGRGSA